MSSQFERLAGAHDHHVQQHVRDLLQSLGWSYAALWILNHRTRVLGWKCGHFRMNPSGERGHGDTEVWNEQLFYSTYKSCNFSPGLGSIGMANAEGRNIWLNGVSIYQSVSSREQAQFLESAKIQTMMCIPCLDLVLEIGTSVMVAENVQLMEQIRNILSKKILARSQPETFVPPINSTLAMRQTFSPPSPPTFQQSSLPSSLSMMLTPPYRPLSPMRNVSASEDVNQRLFELNSTIGSLSDQIRRTTSMSSLNTDMFLDHPDMQGNQAGRSEVHSGMLVMEQENWRLPKTRSTDVQKSTATSNHGMMNMVQYRSLSGNTSSSVSSQEDAPARPSLSPEPRMSTLLASSERHSSPSNSSSSARRGASSHSPEIQLADNMITKSGEPTLHHLRAASSGDAYDIQKALSLMFAEGEPIDTQEQWRQIYTPPQESTDSTQINVQGSNSTLQNTLSYTEIVKLGSSDPQAEGPFKIWRHTRVLAPIFRKNDPANQLLLRRCINMMKQIPNMQQGIQNDGAAVITVNQQRPPQPTSSPETVPETVRQMQEPRPSVQIGAPRVGSRPRGGPRIALTGQGGVVHAGHDEAAMNHMMAERRRRVKQKENFTALRRLVPIISKADKASILGDAIVYLKDLQEKIQELEAEKRESDNRYENLKEVYKQLEDRNKELEEALRSRGSGHLHPPRLHSL